MNINKPFIFYPLCLIFFVIDILSSLITGKALILLVTSLFAVAISRPARWIRLTFIFLLLGIESFFFYGYWGLALLYLIPIALIAHRTSKIFASPLSVALLILLSSFMCQFIADFLFGEINAVMFTFLKVFINIVLTICISLTYI